MRTYWLLRHGGEALARLVVALQRDELPVAPVSWSEFAVEFCTLCCASLERLLALLATVLAVLALLKAAVPARLVLGRDDRDCVPLVAEGASSAVEVHDWAAGKESLGGFRAVVSRLRAHFDLGFVHRRLPAQGSLCVNAGAIVD